jgi:hypothetical protein
MACLPRVTIVDADKISDEAAAAIAEVSQNANGSLRIKMHDKHAALVSIGKHLPQDRQGDRYRNHRRRCSPVPTR